MSRSPCKDCADRICGCHSTCEKYMAFADERRQISAAKLKYNEEQDFFVYMNRKARKK